jgi:H+/Cl- antiporter ClcA
MPFAALTGTSFNALVRRARKEATPSWLLIPAIGLAGLLTGTSSIWLPQMPGNGKDIILESLAGDGTLAGAALAVALKPVLTALFIRVGAVGGLLTPALATGVAMGSVFALTINHLGGHASVPTLALIGGAAVLGITQRAPVFAAVFTAELTHPPSQVWVMLLVAALGAQGVRVMAMRRQAARALRSVQMRTVSRNSSRRRLIGNRRPRGKKSASGRTVAAPPDVRHRHVFLDFIRRSHVFLQYRGRWRPQLLDRMQVSTSPHSQHVPDRPQRRYVRSHPVK